jgi:acetyltransferase-like isoleucine patch superfamily enzyme
VDAICDVLAIVPVLLCRAERRARGDTHLYVFFSQLYALVPGVPGVFLRGGFYRGTLQRFGERVHIGFGALVSQPDAVIEDEVYIGAYTIVGLSRVGARTLVGSRVSVLSGGAQHSRTADGGWTPSDPSRLKQIDIGEDVWIGEGAIVMADVGRGTLIGAGSVVSSPVGPDIVVAGNPSRFVRKLDAPRQHGEAAVAALHSGA